MDAEFLKVFVQLANEWRAQQGAAYSDGVVVLFDGDIQGWVNELRNPEHWRPGCVAIDKQGRSWTTIAGNDQSGALMWLPNEPVHD